MITVAMIDSGVSVNMVKKGYDIRQLSLIYDNKELTIKEGFGDDIGHGTAVTDVLTSYRYIDDVSFIMIRIFDGNEDCDEQKLCDALEYILYHLPCDLVHISNGITACSNVAKLEELCRKISERNTVIVSAFDNLGGISFPAAFDSVIGVDYNFENANVFSFDYIENSMINIFVRHSEQRLMWNDNKRRIVQGNSFIAPHVSSMIVQFLCEQPNTDRNDILNFLKSKSKNVYSEKRFAADIRVRRFEIKKACFFPFNKEIQVLARFEDMCSFEIRDYYDIKYLGNCGRKISQILKNTHSDKRIENIDNIDWNEDFDTFILGHTDKIAAILGRSYADKLIAGCIRNNKNLFVFDDRNITEEIKNAFADKGLGLYYPSVKNRSISFRAGKLYSFATPILAVLGTSSKQGKFTLQLNIKRWLTEMGYDVGHLGTEPMSLLAGADDDLVMGYNSDVPGDAALVTMIVNDIMHKIDRQGHDLILLGSQSHTVPLGYSNIGMLPLDQQNLLLAAQPDACVLCVNYADDTEYIRRTVNYIESLCEAKVIAICVSAFGGESRWTAFGNSRNAVNDIKITEGFSRITEIADIPVFMYDDINGICSRIVSFFSED